MNKKDFVEKLAVKGVFLLEIVDVKTGKILENYADNNLVVNTGRNALITLLSATGTSKNITKVAVGTNSIAPIGTDTAITGAFTKSIIGYSYPTFSSVSFSFQISAGDANGMNINEFGLICDDGTLFARKTRQTISKNSDILLNGRWIITF